MGKIFEVKIDRFDGGIENDPRDPRENTCRMVTNFDVLTNPRKMTPYRDSESGDDSGSTSRKRNFAVALRTGTTYALYALGVVSGTTRAEILYKDFTAFDTNIWTAPTGTTGQSANTFTWFELFVYYRKTGLIYGGRGTSATAGTAFWAFSPTGTAFAESSLTVTFTNLGQGIVHSKDDILYVPYYNNGGAAGAKSFIAKNDNGSWNATALTLPDHLIPLSIAEYGNYLAIACAPAAGVGNSRVFLWDRSEATTILSESIDWGNGELRIIEEVDGILIGISTVGDSGVVGGSAFTAYQQKVIFRYLNGNQAIKFKIIESDNQVANLQLPIAKQKVDNRLYFLMLIGIGNATNNNIRDGVWSIGLQNGQWVLVHEKTTNNNTALASADTLSSFIVVEEYFFIAYQASGTFAVTKTNDSTTGFSHNAIYESKTFDGGDASLKKQLLGVTIYTEYLPANGSVLVRYKMDNETAWTTILTHDTDGEISKSAINIESSGGGLPEFKEISFRIESTGGTATKGAEITGLSFAYEVTGKRNY